MSARRLLAALLVALLAAPVALALSDAAKKAYLEGVRAVEDEEYETAVRKLRDALRDDAAEGVRKFRGTGVSYEDYFPHLYLGIALDKLGRAAEAEKELEESQRQGVSRERGAVYRRLTASLEHAHAAAAAVAQLRPTAAPTTPPPPPPPPTRAAAQPTVPIPTPTPASQRPVPTLRPTVLPTTTPIVSPTVGRTVIPIPPPEEHAAPTPSAEVVADLKNGIRSYFRGDFDGAIRVLERRRESSGTARLFLAYALAGKYLIDGPARDEKLLARAREEFHAAQGAGVALREDRLISRAVRTILEKG